MGAPFNRPCATSKQRANSRLIDFLGEGEIWNLAEGMLSKLDMSYITLTMRVWTQNWKQVCSFKPRETIEDNDTGLNSTSI